MSAPARPGLPLVSVVVPTYDRPELLAGALESLCAQTLQDLEVLVVNDAGRPVEEVVRRSGPPGKTLYLSLAANVDRSAARNRALALARGRYIAYLDDDDRFLPDHLETLVGALRGGARFAYSDARRLHQRRVGDRYQTFHADVPYAKDFDPLQILLSNHIPILCVVHERSLLDEVGTFDEGLRVLEDWDLWIRMSRVTRFQRVPRITCEFSWREDGSSTTSSSKGLFRTVEHEIFLRYLQRISEHPGARNALYRYQSEHLSRLRAEGDAAGALSLLERLVERDDSFAPAVVDLALQYHALGRWREAAARYERALALVPGHPELVSRLEEVRRRARAAPEAG